MRWGITCKPDLGHVRKVAMKVVSDLRALEQEVLVEERVAKGLEESGTPWSVLNKDVDILVAIGGDGTLLMALHRSDRPVLGVNAGAVGFLTEVEPDDFLGACRSILAGKYVVERRPKLAVRLNDEPIPDATNEVTIQTAKIAKLIKFRVEVDGEEVDVVRGDGLIVATATGSTGYAMSVGGPLLHPRVPALVVAPIAPFRLAARPIVIPLESSVRVTLLERRSGSSDKDARVVVDGQHGYGISFDGHVDIQVSKNEASFVRLGSNYFQQVRDKLVR